MCLLQVSWDLQLESFVTGENSVVCFEHVAELDAISIAMASGHLLLVHTAGQPEVEEVRLLIMLAA